MALPVNGSTHLIPALLLIYRPRKDERLSWPSWLTCSGWLTHISGHPSAAGRAQDRESSPVRDRRSTAVLRHQLAVISGNLSELILQCIDCCCQDSVTIRRQDGAKSPVHIHLEDASPVHVHVQRTSKPHFATGDVRTPR